MNLIHRVLTHFTLCAVPSSMNKRTATFLLPMYDLFSHFLALCVLRCDRDSRISTIPQLQSSCGPITDSDTLMSFNFISEAARVLRKESMDQNEKY